ncbi:MAG TPA: hypothetical protein DCW60_01200 [Sutterella sp.]|nr:hypothetical protein [Sutterella sp.]
MAIPDNLSKARAQISLFSPFFSVLMFMHELRESKRIETMGVNARGTIFYNPDYIATLTVDECVFMMTHEIMHVVYGHAFREGARNHLRWNIACDAVINETLIKCQIGSFIEGGIRYRNAETMTAEEMYDRIREKTRKKLIFADLLMPDGTLEGGQPLTDAERKALEGALAQELAQAKASVKNYDQVPENLRRFIDDILAGKKLPWYEALARYMTQWVGQELSWKRPNKRFSQYLPTFARTQGMGPVVIGIDTSGSISEAQLAHFAKHINDIREEVNPEKIYVVYCDAEVNRVDEFEPEDPLEFKMYGGGATDMRQIGQWVKTECVDDPDITIIFTDGYTPFPEVEDVETLWLITDEGADAPDYINKIIFSIED